MISVSYGDL